MKKFLLILLIVVAASTKVQHLPFRKLEVDPIMNDWLRATGLYDKIVYVYEKYGIPKAIEFCVSRVSFLLKTRCKGFVENLQKEKNNKLPK